MIDPSQPTEIKDLPRKDVGVKVQQCIQTGAAKIECIKQDNGKWTIRAS